MIDSDLAFRDWSLSPANEFAPDVKESVRKTFNDLIEDRMSDDAIYCEVHSNPRLKDDFFIPNMITPSMLGQEINQPWGMLAAGKFFLEISVNSSIFPKETSSVTAFRNLFGKLNDLTGFYQDEWDSLVDKLLQFYKRYSKSKREYRPQITLVGSPFKVNISRSLATGDHILKITSIYKVEYDKKDYEFPNMIRKIRDLVI